MNILEAIDVRKSRRVYLKDPIPAPVSERLMELMAEFNREEDLSFRFIEDGSAAFAGLSRSYGMFSGVRALMVLAGKKEDPDRREKCGYYGERLVLEATAYGLGTCWVAGTFDRSHPDLGVPEGFELECVIPVGLAPTGKAMRERIIHRLTHGFTGDSRSDNGAGKDEGIPVRADEAVFGVQEFGKYLEADEEVPERVKAGISAGLKAPSAKNGRPVRYAWREGKLTASIPDTYRMQWVDLGIAKFHFVLAAGGRFPWGNGAAWISPETAEGNAE